jgi:ABC-2 type transport system ATP-binding protein
MIVATNLTKYYGDRAAVRDLSFSIRSGEIFGFLGLNGAGKSTTLRMISCQLVPTAGTVTVGGLDVLEDSQAIRRRIGYLPEVAPLYHEMTVQSYLEFVARIKGVPRRKVAERIAQVQETTGLSQVRRQVVGTLSAGYRQRVGIAQAVVHQPEFLILDEPFAGLDPVQTVEMREMIRRLGGQHTVLLSSHLLSQIHETCDRIIVIQRGRVVAQGTEQELVATLTGGGQVEMEVRGEAEAVEQALSAVEGVSRCHVTPLGEGLLRVRAEAGDEAREALAAAVVQGGFGLRGLRRSTAELESVFVQLTQDNSTEPTSPAEDSTSGSPGAGEGGSSASVEEVTPS